MKIVHGALYHFTSFLLRFRVPLPNLHKLPEQIATRHCSGTPVPTDILISSDYRKLVGCDDSEL